MSAPVQLELATPAIAGLGLRAPINPANVEWFVAFLSDSTGWTTAAVVLQAAGRTVSDDQKRYLRILRRAAGGRIAGGPGMPGYRLITSMTQADYTHWRNTMLSQAKDMQLSVIESDRVFYARQPRIAVGVLEPTHPSDDYSI